MLYPRDDKAHREWMLRNIITYIADRDAEAIRSGKANLRQRMDIGALLGANIHEYGGGTTSANSMILRQTSGLQTQSNDLMKRGKQAGLMLQMLLLDQNLGGAKAAADKLVKAITAGANQRKGKVLTENADSLLNRVWPQFRPVAHLWTTYLTPHAFDGAPPGRWLPLHHFQFRGLKGFLELAETLRQAGSERFPKRGPRSPILPPYKSWIVKLQHSAV